jgi:hypothetical protein
MPPSCARERRVVRACDRLLTANGTMLLQMITADDCRFGAYRSAANWLLYLGYCEGACHDRHVGDVQLLLAKAANRRMLYGEPWSGAPAIDDPVRRAAVPAGS